MGDWGPEVWAVMWQSAPARLRERSGWPEDDGVAPDRTATQADRTVTRPDRLATQVDCGSTQAERGQQAERPVDRRPPTRRTRGRRALFRQPVTSDSGADGANGPDSADMRQLESQIRCMASDLAASTCQWLHLIDRFDAGQGWAGIELRSCAAWLSWTCSVSPGTAREYLRARMLPLLPLVDKAFADGLLSYSKVRALVRIADRVDEAVLLQQAQVQTVSQFERTVRAFRRTDGDGWGQQQRRRAVWRWDDDGMLILSARLPADEGALLVAALERAREDIAPRPETSCDAPAPGVDSDGADPHGVDPHGGDPGGGDKPRGARRMPEPTADDRERATLTHADPLGLVGADALMALAQRVPPQPSPGRHSWRRTVGRTTVLGPRCHLEDGPGLDLHTAERIGCAAAVVAVLHHVGEGEPLRLGRKTRTISPAQRRALRVRNGGCRYPGCHRRHYLQAHHVRHWSHLGPTDLENLVLVCRFHHMLIHEGGFRVTPDPADGWAFHDPNGAQVPTAPALGPASSAASDVGAVRSRTSRASDPLGLMSGWAGEPFHLAETVAVLTRSPRSDARPDQQAAAQPDPQAFSPAAPQQSTTGDALGGDLR